MTRTRYQVHTGLPRFPRLPYSYGLLLGAVLLVHVLVSLAYLVSVPLFNWPDEPAHFNYVRRLADGQGLDVIDPSVWAPTRLEALKRTHFAGHDATSAAIASIRYEAYQPPLYYALAALVYTCTRSPLALKLFNLLLSCATLVIAFVVARSVYPEDRRIAITAVCLLALVPTRRFMAVSINNDLLAEVMFGLFLLAVLRRFGAVRVGILIGLGILVKVNLLLTLPLYALWLIFVSDRRGSAVAERQPRRPARMILMTTAVAALVSAPWLARNIYLYGWLDPFALVVGAWGSDVATTMSAPRHPQLTLAGSFGIGRFVALLFESWWGVFGWMEMFTNRGVLAYYVLLSLVPVAGLLTASFRRKAEDATTLLRRRVVLWFSLAVALLALSTLLYASRDFQAQGRYLMLASTPIAVLYAIGLRAALGKWMSVWVALTSLGLLWVNVYVVRHVIPWYLGR